MPEMTATQFFIFWILMVMLGGGFITKIVGYICAAVLSYKQYKIDHERRNDIYDR